MPMPGILKLLFTMCLGTVVIGCNSTMRSMVGEHNVNSVQLARRCMVDSALVVARQSREHQSIVNRTQGLLLEIVYLTDLHRAEEARAFYPQLIEDSPWHKSEKDVDRAVKRARKDLGKMRKRSGYPKSCNESK